MRKHLLLAGVILFSLLIACTKDDKATLCGPQKVFILALPVNKLTDSSGGGFHTYMEGNNRVFQWSELIENVCSDEHVRVSCEVSLHNINAPIIARARISWSLLFERKINLTKTENKIRGGDEAGLKQAYGDAPGSFVPTLEIPFPSRGSYSADTTFLTDEVMSIYLEARYWEYSP
jgi:hypothetical protein